MLTSDESVLGGPTDKKLNQVLWIVTGSGTCLRAIPRILKYLVESGVRVTIGFTKAGYEVARMYGVAQRIIEVINRVRAEYNEVYVEGWSYSFWPLTGRVALRKYDVVVIAPATSNTIAKIVHGIADSLASAVASQALKSGVSLVVLPSDKLPESITELPCIIDDKLCINCGKCIRVCPTYAIAKTIQGRIRIDLLKCIGCEACRDVCPVDAVKCWEKTSVKPSEVDVENLEKLKSIKGVTVVEDCLELVKMFECGEAKCRK